MSDLQGRRRGRYNSRATTSSRASKRYNVGRAGAPRADFMHELHEGNIICIVDEDRGSRSVTNDIEAVLADVAEMEGLASLAGYSVTYRDSDLTYCQVVLTPGGAFATFRGFGQRVTSESEALRLLRATVAAA